MEPPFVSQPLPDAKPRRRWLWRALAVGGLLVAYPAFVLGTAWTISMRSGLPGGRNGPRDAYRHALASAIVAFTASPRFVTWTTACMEGDALTGSHAMDAHNNRIGARLGATAASWEGMLRAVRAAVDVGRVAARPEDTAADPDRIVWLPQPRWGERDY